MVRRFSQNLKRFALVLFGILVLLCCNSCFPSLRDDRDGNLMYDGNKYIFISGKTNFLINYETIDKVGTIRGMLMTIREVGFSDLDSDNNVLCGVHYTSWIWLKDGFEFPYIYECRINKMQLSTNTIWESSNQFLTLNDLIDKKVEKTDWLHTSPTKTLFCFFEDYKYLKSDYIPVYYHDSRVYIGIYDVCDITYTYYSIKNEYAGLFPLN